MEASFESESMEEMSEKKKKKRRRRKNLDVEMEALSEVGDRTAPLVGYFPSGFDPLKGKKEAPTVRVFRNKKRSNRLELVVSPKGSNVEFVGKSYAGEAAGPQLCTYALGVLDKERQSLRIVPIATNKILRMEPRVLGKTSVDNDLHEGLKDEELTTEKRGEKLRELTALYGSKKDKSRDQKWAAMTQRDDPNAQENLKGQLKDIEVNEEAIEDATREVILNIPPHDPTASTPEKAYLLDEIIFKWERDHLLDILELMQSGEKNVSTTEFWQENGYPSFVYNRIHELREVQDEEEKKKLAFIFSYITHLVTFMDMASQSRGSNSIAHAASANYHNIPRIIFQKFVKLFVNPESQALSKEKKDLIISYILVLTLFADKFETQASDIAKDLKMTHLSLRPYFEQLGCKLRSEKAITLPVPLQLSRPERARRKRR